MKLFTDLFPRTYNLNNFKNGHFKPFSPRKILRMIRTTLPEVLEFRLLNHFKDNHLRASFIRSDKWLISMACLDLYNLRKNHVVEIIKKIPQENWAYILSALPGPLAKFWSAKLKEFKDDG